MLMEKKEKEYCFYKDVILFVLFFVLNFEKVVK